MNLKEIRKEKGLSQSQLAGLAGVSVRTLQEWEQGKRNIDGASLPTLCCLSDALGVKIYDILEDEKLAEKLRKNLS